MTHLKSNKPDELEDILANLRLNEIHYKIAICEGLIIELDTEDETLIAFAKANNPELS